MTLDITSSQSSETTGFQKLALTAARPIGQQLGEIGAVAKREPSRTLASILPAETDNRLMASLERIGGQRPVFKRHAMCPENAPTYWVIKGMSWTCPQDRQKEALEAVDHSLRPAHEETLAQALYTLRTVTRGRTANGDDDREAEAMIWIEALRAYPADIVIDTLRTWSERKDGMWWPTWHDVQKVLAQRSSDRQFMFWHIKSGKCLPMPKVETSQEPTAESRARVRQRAAEVREMLNPKPAVETSELTIALRNGHDDKARSLIKASMVGVKLSAEALAIVERQKPTDDDVAVYKARNPT
jgi:hypothetical protein